MYKKYTSLSGSINGKAFHRFYWGYLKHATIKRLISTLKLSNARAYQWRYYTDDCALLSQKTFILR